MYECCEASQIRVAGRELGYLSGFLVWKFPSDAFPLVRWRTGAMTLLGRKSQGYKNKKEIIGCNNKGHFDLIK